MDKEKFIIYGAGYRGDRLLEYLGRDRVLAYIDSNEDRIGSLFKEIPIISVDRYKRDYWGVHIIISPSGYRPIEVILDENEIKCYSRLSDLPSEFSGYGRASFDECYTDIIKKYDKPCYIKGRNAFALLLWEKLIESGNRTEIVDNPQELAFGILFIATGEEEEEIKALCPWLTIVDAFYCSSLLPMYYNANIAKLRNKYENIKRCFIIATGPSLNKQDVEKIWENSDFSIGVNRIFLLDSAWHPDVYMVTDSVLLKEEKERISQYHANLKIYGDSNEPPDKEGEVVHIVSDVSGVRTRFSDNVAQRIYGGGTVTYAAIQFAIYLGIKEIYLLGVDCNYKSGSKVNHFYETDKGDKFDHKTDKMIQAFEVAERYASSHGVRIFNATRGGMLEVFERVDFDGLFT